ncbi:MAG: tRNA (adenosine(37)-N6)-dimethylallyltransferase MiaA [Lentisphaerae bacterium]|nr:tRNA (adenosine(37)-N6)-dimethylallyltransferase MiaA [Lentisphaerota bacterium]
MNAGAAPAAPRAYVLVGPTAVGKSGVAQWVAEQHGFAILSADSMQVYRGMDIGTAKATRAERERATYFGLDLADPSHPFSVSDWLAAAREACRTVAPRPLIVVGGTGLYLRCLVEGLHAGPAPDPVARARWEGVLAEEGVGGLQAALRARDPTALAALADPQNPRRLMRALERYGGGGVSPAPRAWPSHPAHVPFVGLRLPAAALQSRIELRVRAMYDQGLMMEVEHLLGGPAPLSETARQAIGYAEAFAARDGQCARADAIARTIQRTRQYAKRQRTWFARQANVSWIDITPDLSVDVIARAVLQRWQDLGPTVLTGIPA